MEPLLTHEETARWLNVSPQTLRRLGDAGEIPRYRVRGQWRYEREAIKEYLERNRDGGEVKNPIPGPSP